MLRINGIFLKPSMHPFSRPPGKNQQIRKQCLPPMFFKISLRDISFHISLNCLGFYLSRMFVQFSLTCVGKFFDSMVLSFLENALKLCIFTHAPVPYSNSRYNFLKICTPLEVKGGENYDLLYQNLIRKYEDVLEH